MGIRKRSERVEMVVMKVTARVGRIMGNNLGVVFCVKLRPGVGDP